jgi:hypothetical protein
MYSVDPDVDLLELVFHEAKHDLSAVFHHLNGFDKNEIPNSLCKEITCRMSQAIRNRMCA